MGYELVDQVLEPWSSARHLHIYSEYKNESVRSIDIVGHNDSKVQIWIDPPSADGIVKVHLWDYGSRREEWSGPIIYLNTLLDGAYELATEWLDEPRTGPL